MSASVAAVPTGPTTALPTSTVTGAPTAGPVAPTIPDGSTAIPTAAADDAADADWDDSTSGPPAERRDHEDDDGEGPEGPWQVWQKVPTAHPFAVVIVVQSL